MWKKKSPSEINKAERQSATLTASLYAALVFVLVSFGEKAGFHRFEGYFKPISWLDYLNRTPVIAIVAVIIFIIVRAYLIKHPRRKGYMCIKCGGIYAKRTQENCECGGRIYPVHHLKWTEDNDHHNSDKTSTT